jgi:hypothetical protein
MCLMIKNDALECTRLKRAVASEISESTTDLSCLQWIVSFRMISKNFHMMIKFEYYQSYPSSISNNLLNKISIILIAAVWVRAWVRPREICSGQIDIREGFLRVLPFPLPSIPSIAAHTSSFVVVTIGQTVVDVPSGLSLIPPKNYTQKHHFFITN